MANDTFMEALMIETLPSLLVAIATLALTWGVGHRLTTYWSIQQKRKELELVAANNFYEQYGEFFAIWKLWNYALTEKREADSRIPLLERAAAMEAGLEATLVKIASERVLAAEDQEALGRLRQGFQLLRESIKRKRELAWHGSGHAQYIEFKRLATRVGNLLASVSRGSIPTPREAAYALKCITDNKHEEAWRSEARIGPVVPGCEELSATLLVARDGLQQAQKSGRR